MTVVDDISTASPSSGPATRRRRRVPLWGWLVLLLVVLSAVRVVSSRHELTSSGTLREALYAAIPIALAALAGLWAERAGVVNIGLEGMMILGTIGGAYFAFHHGWFAGLVAAVLFGTLGGALHALATVWFGVDHIVSGVAINIMAGGLAASLARAWFSGLAGGGPTQSPPLPSPPTINIPPVIDAARSLEDRHWFVVSDLASIVGALTRNLSTITVLAVVLVLASWWILWRTSFGLRLRSCGESPSAAETLGVDVYRYKTYAVLISGGIAGLAGGFLVVVWAGLYQNGITNGRGYIGLAAMIFGNWRPSGLVAGASLFGYTDALQLRAGGGAVHALLIAVALGLLVYAVVLLRRGRRTAGVAALVGGLLVAFWWSSTDEIANDFVRMTPYVATLLVLALASQRLRMPAADGKIYRKGEAG